MNGMLVILKSTDDGVTFQPIKQADVPEWITPEVLGRIVDGEIAQHDDDTECYAAIPAPSMEDSMIIAAAKAKRIRRTERNIRMAH